MPVSKEEYLKRYGHCPYCGNDGDLDGGFVEIDGNLATQNVQCNACGNCWTDIYRLFDVVFPKKEAKTVKRPRNQDEAESAKIGGIP